MNWSCELLAEYILRSKNNRNPTREVGRQFATQRIFYQKTFY